MRKEINKNEIMLFAWWNLLVVVTASAGKTPHINPSILVSCTYNCIFGTFKLFCQAHQQDIWAVLNPVISQLLFGLCTDCVVRSAQSAEQLREGGVDFGRQQ
jgi:hypothetical protein